MGERRVPPADRIALHRIERVLVVAQLLELIAALNCAKYGKFREGVRAQIIDKDNNPQFTPATLAALTAEIRQQYLTPPWGDAPHPLADL